MNTPRFVTLSRLVLAVGLVAASAAAQAGGGVYWAVNVDAPLDGVGRISTAVSNTRHGVAVQPAQVYYAPPPVVYAPQPVVYAPPPVFVEPRRAYCPPQAVVYQPVRYVEARGPWWWHHHHDEDRREWREERRDDRGERGYEGGEHRHWR